MHYTICPEFQSMKASGINSKSVELQGTLEIKLHGPFRILLDTDSDVETPSPLTLCFDFPKPPSSPATTEWTDSDSEASPVSDEPQYIAIPHDSPLYSPHLRPAFDKSFEIPRVPFPSQPRLDDEDYSAYFHAELEHILPSDVKKDLFLVDEASLRGMDDDVFAAPLDAFMAVCLARLQIPARPPPRSSGESGDISARFPKYYLASFLDLDRSDASPLDPSLRELFCKRALLTTRSQASPATTRETIPFL
ncbi:hypothetical protein C8R45DRAFT_1093811 [Mycena sanguinolenta]|nr:hypothetical protein C8R45DRAFT_1093811 [Mycena sanguinolenta]